MLHVASYEGLRILTLDRPAVGNALDDELAVALTDAVTEAGVDLSLHTLVLRAEGRHFCTGFDLSDLENVEDGELLRRFVNIELLLAALWHCPLRTVAFGGGRAWGAGADLFACCDLRVAREDSTFCFPGVRFGLVLGTRRLASRVGEAAARRVLTEGKVLAASEALALGLASESTALEFDSWLETLAPVVVERETAAGLKQAVREDQRDRDLAALVRSAARPGLKQRILAYRANERAARPASSA
ncbi:MAG: enoyl-CoA hydratase/isomerase family protein [Gammaproteobacteria bacterium]|nr:enoyl-CoA hydratase/isomerase family protein [Gammaproteobacteria bacterium]